MFARNCNNIWPNFILMLPKVLSKILNFVDSSKTQKSKYTEKKFVSSNKKVIHGTVRAIIGKRWFPSRDSRDRDDFPILETILTNLQVTILTQFPDADLSQDMFWSISRFLIKSTVHQILYTFRSKIHVNMKCGSKNQLNHENMMVPGNLKMKSWCKNVF